MIFLVLIAIIALIVIALNMKDNANLQQIEDYLKKQNCKNIVYAKGSFKGVCNKKIIQIKNSFSVDLEKNKLEIKLENIKNLEQKENTIIINETYNLEFKEDKNRDVFYKSIKESLNR